MLRGHSLLVRLRAITAGPLVGLALGLGLVLAISLMPGGWGPVYGQTVDGGNTNDDDDDGQDQGCGDLGDDVECERVDEDNGGFASSDGVLSVRRTGGEAVVVIYEPETDPLGTAGNPPAPGGLREVTTANVQVQPDGGTPNFVNLTLSYTDEELAALGVSEGSLRMFYYDPGLGTWVELPIVIDQIANTVTVVNLDVSAFANSPHLIALFAPPG